MSRYVPPQHGAWAFLGLPLVLGAIVAPWTPLLVLLAIAWVAAYPLSYAALGLVRAKRPQRFRRPFGVWLGLVLPAVGILVAARPWLVWVGLGYLVLFGVNLRYARRNDERALGNDLVFVAECSAMVVVTSALGVVGRSWTIAIDEVPGRVWLLAAICAVVLTGSTLHVKSLIRERRDPRYAHASKVLSLACVPASFGFAAWWGLPEGLWLTVPFVAFGIRAFVVGLRPRHPGVMGMVELAGYLVVAASAVLA